jgi:recombinational DNA repair protein (RecF pathway)
MLSTFTCKRIADFPTVFENILAAIEWQANHDLMLRSLWDRYPQPELFQVKFPTEI